MMKDKIYFIIDADTYEIRSKPFLTLEAAEKKMKFWEKARDIRKKSNITYKGYTVRNYEILDCETKMFNDSYIEQVKQEQKYCDELNEKLRNAHSKYKTT